MNILQVLPMMEVGGVETGTLDLARYLVAHGHTAVVVSGGGRLVSDLEKAGVRHYTLPVGAKSLFTIFAMVGELRDIITRHDIDIVHARSRVPALIAYLACRLMNRIFITTAHGHYRKGFFSRVMSWGRYVIVASHSMAKRMAEDFGVPRDRLRLIPRGVDLSRFPFREPRPRGREFVIGMVSRITPLKGHADLLKAVSLIVRDIPRLKVVIVGSAPKDKYREDLDLLVRGLGLAQTVEFAGAQGDIPSVMRSLDLLVSATVTPEAFGRVIIEAQAAGVPVVATKVGGVVDIVEDGVTGLLCLPRDPRDMAAKITRLYRDRDLAREMAAAARKRVEEEYSLPVMMERTLAVYRDALERPRILVIKMSAIGDVILSVPSLRAIRGRYPKALIALLVGIGARSAVARCPYIDEEIVSDPAGRHRGLAGLWQLGAALRERSFDTVIDLQNNRRSHLLAYLSMAPFRYGYDNGKWSFLLNRKQKDDAPYLDPLDHQFRTLRLAGVKPADKTLELWPSRRDDERVEAFLKENWVKPSHRLIAIQVRASARWFSKNWPPAYIAELCDRLAKELHIRAVLTGSPEDGALAAHIMKLTRSKPVNAVGRTDILELASLIRRCGVLVTPDSAPMHIAAAMGVPVIALFGPTDPHRHLADPSRTTLFWKKGDIRCVPCYRPACGRRVSCMRRITVDEVYDAIVATAGSAHESPERINAL